MRILVIKVTALGDLIHVFPALSDLQANFPGIEIDWLVDEVFADVPKWHPAVKRVIAVAFKRTKKKWWHWQNLREHFAKIRELRQERYDFIIDMQGLYKTAIPAALVRGPAIGFPNNGENVRWLYQKTVDADPDKIHAVDRLRSYFANIFNYQVQYDQLNFQMPNAWHGQDSRTIMFVHSTTWVAKHYPNAYWHELVQLALADGWHVVLPQINDKEMRQAQAIVGDLAGPEILAKMPINAARDYLAGVRAFIAVDTGLSHIGAAMGVPGLSLYGPSNPAFFRTRGERQVHLAGNLPCVPCLKKECTHPDRHQALTPPCFTTIPPKLVWEKFKELIENSKK